MTGFQRDMATLLAALTVSDAERGLWRIQPVSVREFVTRFMRRSPSEKQWEVLIAIFGDSPPAPDESGRLRFFKHRTLVLQIGQGGGKNFVSEIVLCYAVYLWACLADPHATFRLDADKRFDIINMSQVNATQARGVFFDSLSAAIRATIDPETGQNWFERHVGLRLPGDSGTSDMKLDTIEIPCHIMGRRGVRIKSLDSTAKSHEGYCIWIAVLDEPSRANTPALYRKALGQFRVMEGNRNTRFIDPYHSLIVAFSYPEGVHNDLIITLFEQFKDDPTAFCLKASTFEFDPRKRREDAQYVKWYAADPVDALRRFECVLTPDATTFFAPYVDTIDECARLENRAQYRLIEVEREDEVNGEKRAFRRTQVDLQSLVIRGDDKARIVFADSSKTGDSFVIGCGYPEAIDAGLADGINQMAGLDDPAEEFRRRTTPVDPIRILSRPVIDVLIIIKPFPGCPVDYANVEDVLEALTRVFPKIRGVNFDHYESALLEARLQRRGIPAKAHFFSNPYQMRLYRTLRQFVWNRQAEYVNDPTLRRELHDLQRLPNRVDHPVGGSKDVSDVVAGCTYYVCQLPAAPSVSVTTSNGAYLAAERILADRLRRAPQDYEVREFMRVVGLPPTDEGARLQRLQQAETPLAVKNDAMAGHIGKLFNSNGNKKRTF